MPTSVPINKADVLNVIYFFVLYAKKVSVAKFDYEYEFKFKLKSEFE